MVDSINSSRGISFSDNFMYTAKRRRRRIRPSGESSENRRADSKCSRKRNDSRRPRRNKDDDTGRVVCFAETLERANDAD